MIHQMKILYYDCFAGISGDMHLGALIDLGVPAQYLKDELKKLNLEGYELIIESGLKMGISGTKVTVNLTHHHHHHHASHHGVITSYSIHYTKLYELIKTYILLSKF